MPGTIKEDETITRTFVVQNQDGREDLSGLTKVELVLEDVKGNHQTYDSNNSTVSTPNAVNGEIKFDIDQATVTADGSPYRVYARLYTSSSAYKIAPSRGYYQLNVESELGA